MQKDGVNGGVNGLMDVLNEQGLSIVDAVGDATEPVVAREGDDSQILILEHVLQPLVGLLLRVNAETPALSLRHQNTVLERDRVRRQLVHVPLRDLHGVAHDLDQTELFTSGDSTVDALISPLGGELIAIGTGKATEVGDASAGEEDIADELVDLVLKQGASICPTDTFVLQQHDEFLGARHATLVSLDVRFERGFLILELVGLLVQLVDLVLGGAHTSELLVEDGLSLLGCL
mmetsp:Transcript_6479/g.8713  ORF Transcript_6479/g.8713 Transcript_6479/m.8713 type:complete len:233 (+) Transcript_6479:3267-3965(+)